MQKINNVPKIVKRRYESKKPKSTELQRSQKFQASDDVLSRNNIEKSNELTILSVSQLRSWAGPKTGTRVTEITEGGSPRPKMFLKFIYVLNQQ